MAMLEAQDGRDEAMAGTTVPAVTPGKPLLLLVDDDSMVGRFISHAAEECGCDATRTSCVESFRRSFHERRPDIVAVDLSISNHDGIEVIRLLAQEGFDGRVIIVSGLAHRILDAALRLGKALGLHMAEPLSKPFRVEELAERLELGTPAAPVAMS